MGNIARKNPEGIPGAPAPPSIPAKLYYKIGEVCEIAGLPPHVLRFWEHEFPQLIPSKSPKGHRLYRKRDIETILKIKELLYDRKFTIKGAREFLTRGVEGVEPTSPGGAGGVLGKLKDGLHRILDRLEQLPPF
jgi:DNA-binding transcriptional MerR regulator